MGRPLPRSPEEREKLWQKALNDREQVFYRILKVNHVYADSPNPEYEVNIREAFDYDEERLSLWFNVPDVGIEPRVGDMLILFHKAPFAPPRGAEVVSVREGPSLIWYETKSEFQAREKAELGEWQRKRRENFDPSENQREIAERIAELLPVFRERVRRMREKNATSEDEFDRDESIWLSYELFVYAEACKIVRHFEGNFEAFKAVAKDSAKLIELCDLDTGHSGSTLAAAIGFARAYLINSDDLINCFTERVLPQRGQDNLF